MSFHSLTQHLPLARGLRSKNTARRASRRLGLEVKRKLAAGEPLKVVVGAGRLEPVLGEAGTPFEGWLVTDAGSLDALNEAQWRALFPPGRIDRILAEHVVEHFTEAQFRSFLNVMRPLLKASGRIRLAIPDGFHPDPAYVEAVRPGGSGPGSDDHKVLYNYRDLTAIAADAGWDYCLLEYFDEQGNFHQTKWDPQDGFVIRSAEHDPRNQTRPLAYTSIVIDLIA